MTETVSGKVAIVADVKSYLKSHTALDVEAADRAGGGLRQAGLDSLQLIQIIMNLGYGSTASVRHDIRRGYRTRSRQCGPAPIEPPWFQRTGRSMSPDDLAVLICY